MKIESSSKGQKCYLCLARKRLILAKPEEKVRQELLHHLITNRAVPLQHLGVERLLSKYVDTHSKKRADIIIEANTQTATLPIVVIECKRDDIPITFKVIDQVEEYAEILQSDFYCVTNGIERDWYLWDEQLESYVPIQEFNSYQDLIDKTGLTVVQSNPFYATPQHNYSHNFPEKLIPFVDNLNQLLTNTSIQFPTTSFAGFNIIQDGGLRKESNSNPSGEAWEGDYRYFIIQAPEGYTFTVGFCVYIFEYGAYLTVSIDKGERGNHHSLQLYLWDWINIRRDQVSIWHDGTITAGKGSIKRQLMIDLTKSIYPELIVNNQVFFGYLDNSKQFNFNNEDVQDFFINLIKYVLCREEMRDMVSN